MSTDVDKRIDDNARAAARRLRRLIQDQPSLMETVAYLLDAVGPETHASDRIIAIFRYPIGMRASQPNHRFQVQERTTHR